MSTGNATNAMDYIMDNPTSKIEFDLGDGDPNAALSVNDLIETYGNFTLDGELKVKFTDPDNLPQVGDKWNVGKVTTGTYQFLGAFDTIPANIKVNLLDTDATVSVDTLQLEYIPEPASLSLLTLGGLALLRRKRGYGG